MVWMLIKPIIPLPVISQLLPSLLIKAGKGGGVLVRDNEKGGYGAVTGTKNYRWLEAETVRTFARENDIDKEYYDSLARKAIKTIESFGNAEDFIPYYQVF